jgi:CDP-glucose 4,6-dehydratase
LLEALRKQSSVKAILNITSDKCYENKERVWSYREDEQLGGYDPYSSSKACAELVTASFRRSFFEEQGVGLASARAGNVIGGGDWAQDRLIPDILKAFEASVSVNIRNPNAIRPWQHVLEPLGGYLTLVESLWNDQKQFAQGWNFGPKEDDAKSVSCVVESMAELWGGGASWNPVQGDQPHEAYCLKLDTNKARSALNWVSHWNLTIALDKTISWHKAWRSSENLRQFSLDQIKEYTTKLKS